MKARLLVSWLALVVASPAFAEVADKEPSALALWFWSAALNLVAFGLERMRPRLGLIVVPFAAVWAFAGHMEISSPDVGPAIMQELGRSYVVSSYSAYAVGILGPLVLALVGTRTWRRR